MKKALSLIIVLLIVFSFVACSNGGTSNADNADNSNNANVSADIKKVDLSAYPADINAWSAEDFNNYFLAAGVYKDDNNLYVQDHATYWAGSGIPVDEGSGYMDDSGAYFTEVFIIDPNSAEGDAASFLARVREIKALDFGEGGDALPIDHLVGNVAFCYGLSTDEDFYNKMEAAYQQLVADLGVKADF